MFTGRKLLIATKHEKEKVITPLLEKALGVKCFVAENFDTDILGTFTGEVERTDDPVSTARSKCLIAMSLNDCDLAIASEGSFGVHPFLFFIYADDEIVMFIDKKNDLEITARELSTETNFNGEKIKTEKQLFDFAEKSKFPSHALILRKSKEDYTEIIKGITDRGQLKKYFNEFLEKYAVAYVETDMRAMYNPTRMSVIGRAVQKLVDKINSYCSQCNTPGFGITEAKPGLPCNLCGSITRSTLSYI
ncbi:DUF6671 family protein, partial [Mucilaginibacter sp.]|uniref:DUF6671 family protein n=1 Tax=Mucilaginibacter sp. TaxID=1882438 RepID=UPI00374D689D